MVGSAVAVAALQSASGDGIACGVQYAMQGTRSVACCLVAANACCQPAAE